ncbi:hypothetical protein IJK16_03410 [Candidatus Saccharibacteria bacterium]|nr:hypothetical protein [Candidatus Saccharibacteria bacterium]
MKITNKAKILTAELAAVATGFAGTPVFAADNSKYMNDANDGQKTDLMGSVKGIINVAIGLVGLVAVVMIIFGGFQYTSSAGDASKVQKAKNTIMYGVIGLIVALLAFAIVNFVLTDVLK